MYGKSMRAPTQQNPRNRFSHTSIEYEVPLEQPVEIIPDASKSILTHNTSPDLGFSWTVNPYRGCNHACAYCYARPTHEYLSLGAGTDFDTKIVVKYQAAKLLREAFERPSWKGELVMFSGITDCYQPLEARLQLTRECLQVCAEYQNPVAIITKAPLVERDLDLLRRIQENAKLSVAISIPIGDESLARALEPGVATPQRRIQTIGHLADAGIDVSVMVAPIIPGVSDEGLADVLERAREAGARSAGYVLLRLPLSVKEVFETRIREVLPLQAEKILHRIRETRGGALYDARFGVRGVGEGPYAEAIARAFELTCAKLGFEKRQPKTSMTFRRPKKISAQLSLF
jgi:DNA repair photolyase